MPSGSPERGNVRSGTAGLDWKKVVHGHTTAILVFASRFDSGDANDRQRPVMVLKSRAPAPSGAGALDLRSGERRTALVPSRDR